MRGYNSGCRCDGCRRAKRRDNKARQLARSAGQAGLVDAEPARRHLLELTAAGSSLSGLARQGNWKSRTTLQRILHGQAVRADTRTRVLHLRAEARPGSVDARAGRDMLRSLAAIGWAAAELAQASGLSTRSITAIRSGTRARITPDSHQLIRATWEAKAMTCGPSERAQHLARERHWPAPLDLDEDAWEG